MCTLLLVEVDRLAHKLRGVDTPFSANRNVRLFDWSKDVCHGTDYLNALVDYFSPDRWSLLCSKNDGAASRNMQNFAKPPQSSTSSNR